MTALFWPDKGQSKARAELRRTLSVLNRELGSDGILADRETAQLNHTVLRPTRSRILVAVERARPSATSSI